MFKRARFKLGVRFDVSKYGLNKGWRGIDGVIEQEHVLRSNVGYHDTVPLSLAEVGLALHEHSPSALFVFLSTQIADLV